MKKAYLQGRHLKKNKLKNKVIFLFILLITLFIGLIFFIKKDNSTKIQNDNSKQNTIENSINTNEQLEECFKEIVQIDMPEKMGDYDVVGLLVIEKINFEKYILNKTTDKSLKLSVTKFYGPLANERGNFCITGHNTKGFFKKLKELEVNDTFYIIDKANCEKVTYKIYDKYTIQPTNLDCLKQNTDNKREVTLITCNPRRGNKANIKGKRDVSLLANNNGK